jgi:hypothetical protein
MTADPAVIGKVEPATTEAAKKVKVPICEPTVAMGEVNEILRKIQAQRSRRLFVLCSGSIDDDSAEEVYRWRAELKDAGEGSGLDILLHSPGGVLSSCYQIARLIGTRADAWEALIPSIAASGASLIALGSARVVMGEMAFLGPIDPQVSSKRNEKLFASERQSPLEAFEAVRYLREFALSSLAAHFDYLLRKRIAPKPALDTATSLAFHLVQPILSKIEPYDLGSFALDSRLALQYCERVGNPSNQSKKTQRSVPYRALVEQYPAHEFIIDLEEARALKFEVASPDSPLDELFDELRPLLDGLERYIGFVPDEEAKP